MKTSIPDPTEIKMRNLVYHECNYTFPEFLVEMRKIFCRTRSDVCYELDLDYNDLIRLESGIQRSHKAEKVKLLAEYYGVDSSFLEEKSRLWSVTMKKKHAERKK